MHDPFVIDEDEDDAEPSRPLDQATALNLVRLALTTVRWPSNRTALPSATERPDEA